MSLFSFFSGSTSSGDDSNSLAEIYPMSLASDIFVKADMLACYTKILTDTLERTFGITDKIQSTLWDNCVQSENSDGLVTMLARAMVNKADLFLVYKPSIDLLREADAKEQNLIRADYKSSGASKLGVFISFKNYRRTDMLFVYSAMEYCIISSLHKSVNIAKAVQIKMSNLRDTVSLADSSVVITQAKSIAGALGRGADVLLDKDDEITNATPDVGPTEKAIGFLDAKRAYILNLPMSYISGEQTTGIGTTGESDMRAVERGLKQYYFSIIKPVIEVLFTVDTQFKSHDFRQITSALEALKTFELVADNGLLSRASMQEILARLFDIDRDEEQKLLEDEAKALDASKVKPEVVKPDAVKQLA